MMKLKQKQFIVVVLNILGEGVGDDVASGAVKNDKKKIKKPNGILFRSNFQVYLATATALVWSGLASGP